MNDTLLQQFLKMEYNDFICKQIDKAFDDFHNQVPPIIKHFEYNRFEITLDGEKSKVTIADVLDGSEEGIQEITFDLFEVERKKVQCF